VNEYREVGAYVFDNRDPREVGREAAARGEAILAQLVETQRKLDVAVKELARIASEMRGRPVLPEDRWTPCALHMRMDDCAPRMPA
jgi:hypothetical protein